MNTEREAIGSMPTNFTSSRIEHALDDNVLVHGMDLGGNGNGKQKFNLLIDVSSIDWKGVIWVESDTSLAW